MRNGRYEPYFVWTLSASEAQMMSVNASMSLMRKNSCPAAKGEIFITLVRNSI